MKVGFYEKEITAPLGCRIPGYYEVRISSGVKQKLFAKACVVEQDGTYAAFVAIDSLQTPYGANEVIRERVSKATPIPPESILIAGTHAHTAAPCYSRNTNDLNEQEQMELKVINHINMLAADAIVLAYQRLESADAYYAYNEVTGISFIRQYYLKSGEIRTNPGAFLDEVVDHCGASDPALPIVLFKDKAGKPLGSISSFAVHHDTVHGTEYSSDYSGMLGKNLKEKYGQDFVSVFYQGFCGDINHFDYCHKEDPFWVKTEKIAETLTAKWLEAVEKAEKMEDRLQVRWDTVTLDKRKIDKKYLDSLLELVNNPPDIHNVDISDPESDVARYIRSQGVISWYITNKTEQFSAPVQVILLGDLLIFPFVGEQFSQFAHDLRAGSPSKRNMTISIAHDNAFSGYYPTEHMFLPNVYESTYSSCRFAPGSSAKIVKRSLELAKEMF